MLTRHGILRERFADTLTDALRAALLRREGYRVDVVEFVESAHTPRNTLLRAVRTGADGSEAAREYDELLGAWGVKPGSASCSGMAERRRVALGALVAVPFLLGAAAGAPGAADHPAFRFADPEIVESSGLVVLPGAGRDAGLVVTTNDSGDSGRVFTVDPATGDTVGVTSWPTDPDDVEALAPAGPGPRLGRRHRRQPARPRLRRGAPGAGRSRRPGRRARGVRARLPRRRARRRGAGQPPRDRSALRHHEGRLRRHGVRRPAAAARRPAQPPDRGRPGAGHRHRRHVPARRRRGGHAHLLDGPPVGVPVVAGASSRGTLPAQDQGEGIALAGRRAARQHRGRPLAGAPGGACRLEAGATDLRRRRGRACAGSRRRTACRS